MNPGSRGADGLGNRLVLDFALRLTSSVSRLAAVAGFVALLLLLVGQPAPADDGGAEIEEATGAHTRVVWVEDKSPQQTDVLARGKKLVLMGLDTRDGKGERAILPAVRNYAKPLITPDGRRVVYSDHHNDK